MAKKNKSKIKALTEEIRSTVKPLLMAQHDYDKIMTALDLIDVKVAGLQELI